MTDEQPTQTGDLGEQPEPEVEPPEPNPGGADALPLDHENVPAERGPESNPEVEELPDPLKAVLEEGEDTETKATESEGGDESEDSSGETEPPA